MKGIAHFAVGVAVASFFPEAVRAGAAGNPLYFILGGLFGLLPDTLDFKVARYFYRHDVEVTPDPHAPDPQVIADAVAGAVNRAGETGRPVRIKLNTIALGADLWRRYEVEFDVAQRLVRVRFGPVVDTGQTPVPGSRPPPVAEATAALTSDVQLDYLATTTVDIFDGPLFTVEPGPAGRVVPRFIAWHRLWSHSLVIGGLLGLAVAAVWGRWAGAVACAAVAAHALCDQLGYMGTNLFFPFQRVRIPGLKLMHSGETSANFGTVWTSCLLIFWNLSRALPADERVRSVPLFLWGLVVPVVLWLLLGWFRRLRST